MAKINKAIALTMTEDELRVHSEMCDIPIHECPACDIYMNGFPARNRNANTNTAGAGSY